MRAAENSIKELKPEKQISFLFLPNNEDPDSFINKYGKSYFIDYSKKIKFKSPIYFLHYQKQTENNPSSLAIFDKKLRSIANTIKDDYIKKYVLEYFLERISELTPHTTGNNDKNYNKKTRSLETTKKHTQERQSLTGVELKEFSLLYLIMTNLDLIQKNLHLIENVKFFTEINKQIFEKILSKLRLTKQISIDSALCLAIFLNNFFISSSSVSFLFGPDRLDISRSFRG